ncbi:beta-galactosidase [Nonomuraea spiralis]|uniref:Beta-galactosidase n=1 Tax=Nonomuraea spiralis TaxID=46182 RepID=A0ABV5IG45_9ACTN|nr:beta-galactosidase [Nonomuraea spiralis]GGT30758.1 hypothetical protein GCM10010176_089250 [Nonomuraea spiralis]
MTLSRRTFLRGVGVSATAALLPAVTAQWAAAEPRSTLLTRAQLTAVLGRGAHLPLVRLATAGDLTGAFGAHLPSRDDQVSITGWAGADDLSADLALGYDAERLYVAATVTDNVHHPIGGTNQWQGDGLQVAFGDGGGGYGPEYGLALLDGGPEVYRFSDGAVTSPVADVTLTARRDGTKTHYLAAFPWASTGVDAPAPGGSVLFNAIVNDNDGANRRGWIQWRPGIATGKSAQEFVRLAALPESGACQAWITLDEDQVEAGSTIEAAIFVLNWDDSDRRVEVTGPDGATTPATIPARTTLQLTIPITATTAGELAITASVKDLTGGATTDLAATGRVTMSAEAIARDLAGIAASVKTAGDLLAQCEDRGIPTHYERVDATTLEKFTGYTRDDVAAGQRWRATYNTVTMTAMADHLLTRLRSLAAGKAEGTRVPRYVTGPIGRDDWMFTGTVSDGGKTRKGRPVVFSGPMGWAEVVGDIPKLADLGFNACALEMGPQSAIVPPDAIPGWGTTGVGEAAVTFARDASVAHGSAASLRVSFAGPRKPNNYRQFSQLLTVEPGVAYRVRAWIKGQDVTLRAVSIPTATWATRYYPPEGTYDWQQVEFTLTPGNVSSYRFSIICEGQVGALWIDDLTITRADGTGPENIAGNGGFDEAVTVAASGEYAVSPYEIDRGPVRWLAAAAEANVALSLLLAPQYFPAFLTARHPELKLAEGYDVHHPLAREVIEAFLRTIIPRIAKSPALHSLILSNEPRYVDTASPSTRLGWARFLTGRYRDIAALNKVYGTAHRTFDEVPAPGVRAVEPTVQCHDWITFNTEAFASWHAWMAEVVHNIAPGVPVHSKMVGSTLKDRNYLLWGPDPEQWAAFSQLSGNDASNYPGQGVDGFLGKFAFYDLQAGIARTPVFDSEDHVIPDRSTSYSKVEAAHVAADLWQGALHGRSATTFWVWARTTEAASTLAGSMLHRPDVIAAAGRTSLDLNRFAAEVALLQGAGSGVGIVYSRTSSVYSVRHLAAVREVYKALTMNGIPVHFVTESGLSRRQVSDEVKMLIAPGVTHLPAACLRGLRDLGREVRLVVAGADALARDERNQALPAGERAQVLRKATVLPDDGPAGIGAAVLGLARRSRLDVVTLERTAGGTPTTVEWRPVHDGGRCLVGATNYGTQAEVVTIRLHGRGPAELRDLLTGERLDRSRTELAPLTPRLLMLR